jgi:hypothetical protein
VLPCVRGSDQRLRFDPVVIEISLREQARTMGEWGDSECATPPQRGIAP